jgi:hypothetical protein
MPSFTKDQMFKEMQEILAAEAARISVVRSDEAALAYLGLAKSDHSLHDIPASEVDLSVFSITSVMSDAFEYAYQPNATHTEQAMLDVRHEGWMFVRGAMAPSGITNPFLNSSTNICETVMETVDARYALDFEENDLTIQQLALLADMSEGSVRNAARAQGEARLDTKNDGKRTYVTWEEAHRWLSGRKGYVPSPIHRADPVSAGDIQAAQSTGELGALLARLRTHQNRSENDLAGELSWPLDKLQAWESGKYEFGVEDGKSLAKALGLDPVVFVPKAVELALRRDA